MKFDAGKREEHSSLIRREPTIEPQACEARRRQRVANAGAVRYGDASLVALVVDPDATKVAESRARKRPDQRKRNSPLPAT